MPLALEPYGCIGNARFLTAKKERLSFDSEKGKALLREWKLPETLRGVGAIALGYPAQEAGQPAARKQNYIVRI